MGNITDMYLNIFHHYRTLNTQRFESWRLSSSGENTYSNKNWL